MGPSKEGTRILHSVKPSTNLSKDMRAGNRPNSYTRNGLTGIRVTLPAETLDAKLASLPEGVSVSRDRIEVRFGGAKEAVERLYALAYALVNDYERFEALVDGEAAGDRGEVSE